MLMNLERFVSGPPARRRSLRMLITIADLPGDGWKLTSESGWRSGTLGRRSPVRRRAYKSGTYQVVRRFRQSDPPRSLLAEVLPTATSEDGESQVRKARSAIVESNSEVVRSEEKEIEGIRVPNVESSMIWETVNVRGDLRGYERIICGRVENITFMVAGAAWGEGWSWNDLIAIASAQATKVRTQLSIEKGDASPSSQ